MTDEWGRTLYHDVSVPAVTDLDEIDNHPERMERQPLLNPECVKPFGSLRSSNSETRMGSRRDAWKTSCAG